MKKLKTFLIFFSLLLISTVTLSFGSLAADKLPAPVISKKSSTSSSVTFSWEKVDGASGYKIYMLSENGKYVAQKSVKDTTYTASNLKSNTSYTFRIRAYKTAENSKKDFGLFCKSFSCKTKLENVKNLRFVSSTSTAIKLQWDKHKDATAYNVYYRRLGDKEYKFYAKTTSTSCAVKKLDSKTAWQIKVAAVSENNISAYTKTPAVYTNPKAPSNLSVSKKDGSTVTVTWDKVSLANTYYVYISKDKDSGYKCLGSTKSNSFVCNVNEPKATRYIVVKAAVVTDFQKSKSAPSDALKAKTGNISITLPSVIRKGEYPDIKVNSYTSKVKWTSSNTDVIKVKGSRLFANGKGTATITAKYKDCKASVKVTVSSPVINYMSAVYDVTNGKYVFENRQNSRCYPASITKLITALVALKYMDEDDVIVVGDELNMVESLSSRCYIYKGEKFKLKDILYGLLLPSGGDAAYTIAVNVARKVSGNSKMGYVEAKKYFVSLMNNYMKSIGATGTHCVNPHGYPVDGHYSTVHDLVLVAQRVLKNSTLKKITATSRKTVTALTGKTRTWKTTNGLISTSSGWYSPYAHGMKTGTVNDNYTGIISAATKNGRTIITVVVGCESYNARYQATRKLYNAYL